MTTVYLCIGTPKTGTTALQSFMRENEKLINEQGYSFPYMDLGILPIFRDRNAHFLVHQSELPTPEEREKEFETVRANGYKIVAEEAKKYKNIILTDELVWNRCNEIENFWPDLIENFKRMNCEIKVVVYLRRQDLIIQSLWNQHVKVARRIWKTFRECIYGEYFNYFPLDYYAQLSKIAQYVKKENMIVRPYEKGQFEENSIHADFFKAVGLSLTDAFTREKVEPNVGLKGNYIEIKRILNCVETYREMDDFMRRPVLNASKCQDSLEPYPQESMFTYEEQIEYMKRFEESNQKVAKEFLHREDGVLFYESVKELEGWKLNQDTIYRDILMCVAETFCVQEKRLAEMQAELDHTKKELQKLKDETKSMHNSAIFRGYRKVRKIIGHS